MKEDHPLALNLSFALSLGLLPVTLSLKTAGCGIKNSGLPDEEAGIVENSSKEHICFSSQFKVISSMILPVILCLWCA